TDRPVGHDRLDALEIERRSRLRWTDANIDDRRQHSHVDPVGRVGKADDGHASKGTRGGSRVEAARLGAVTRYVVLLRGINVGGKNPVPMSRLRQVLADLGYEDVATYIASGNVILSSNHEPDAIKRAIEAAL